MVQKFIPYRKKVIAMPNDAKLGMVLGIGLVVVIGMVYFRADAPAGGANPSPSSSLNSGLVPPPQSSAPFEPLSNSPPVSLQ